MSTATAKGPMVVCLEKDTESVKKLFPKHTIANWKETIDPFKPENWHKVAKDRDVMIWNNGHSPECYMKLLAARLPQAGALSVKIVSKSDLDPPSPKTQPCAVTTTAEKCTAQAPVMPFTITTFADTPRKEMEWVWKGVIAKGMPSLLAGIGGIGKSYTICDLAARISIGSPMPDGTSSPPGRVLLLNREDAADSVLKPRLEAAGADMAMIEWSTLDTANGNPLDFNDCIPYLTTAAKSRPYALIVVDTFGAFANEGTDTNNGGSVRGLLNACGRLATATEAAVLVIHHLRKGENKDGPAQDSISGSNQFVAGVRVASILEWGKEPDERWLHVVKSNLEPGKQANGYTWTFGPSASDSEHAAIKWSVADESVSKGAAARKAGIYDIPVGDARQALVGAISMERLCRGDSPSLNKKNAEDCLWAALKADDRYSGCRKQDATTALGKILADPGDHLEVSPGPKGATLITLKGQMPLSPEQKAREIVMVSPDISERDLAKLAGCRREKAATILDEIRCAPPSKNRTA